MVLYTIAQTQCSLLSARKIGHAVQRRYIHLVILVGRIYWHK